MKKIFYILILILIAGLYIDARNVGMYCNAKSLQPTFIIQTIIPFRVDRETFLIGYGKKISNFPLYMNDRFYDPDTELESAWSRKTRCIVYLNKQGRLTEGEHFHYIDLRFWEGSR